MLPRGDSQREGSVLPHPDFHRCSTSPGPLLPTFELSTHCLQGEQETVFSMIDLMVAAGKHTSPPVFLVSHPWAWPGLSFPQ